MLCIASFKDYMDFAKKKLKSPDSMEPRFVNFFLRNLNNTLKREPKDFYPLLRLISDCHVPLVRLYFVLQVKV